MELSDSEKREIFRAYYNGFGHTKGKPIETACFTVHTGRDYDLYPYTEVVAMLEEIGLAKAMGELSPCQKSVLHQLKSAGIVSAFLYIANVQEGQTDAAR